jgi:hypothetical protein
MLVGELYAWLAHGDCAGGARDERDMLLSADSRPSLGREGDKPPDCLDSMVPIA